jgi:hypothetical protein
MRRNRCDRQEGQLKVRMCLLKVSNLRFSELKAAVGDISINEKNQVIVIEQNKVFLPPNIYISWGFYDRSVRMGQIGSDKVSYI